MRFNNKTYEEKFLEIFDSIINDFDLSVDKLDENTMLLSSTTYHLEIFITFDGAFVRYKNLNTGIKYDISNYLALKTEDIDRLNLSDSDIISIYIEESLLVRARVLYRKYKDLLKGGTDWFKDYQNSEYFDDLN
ncbi:MAG: hypothetical protein RR646_06045 [Erysipelotrichaceae bacterium]